MQLILIQLDCQVTSLPTTRPDRRGKPKPSQCATPAPARPPTPTPANRQPHAITWQGATSFPPPPRPATRRTARPNRCLEIHTAPNPSTTTLHYPSQNIPGSPLGPTSEAAGHPLVRGASQDWELLPIWRCDWRRLHRRLVGYPPAGRRSLIMAFKRFITRSWVWLPDPVVSVLTPIVTALRATTFISGTRGQLMLTSAVRSIVIRIMGLMFLTSVSGFQVAPFSGDAIPRKIASSELTIKPISIRSL